MESIKYEQTLDQIRKSQVWKHKVGKLWQSTYKDILKKRIESSIRDAKEALEAYRSYKDNDTKEIFLFWNREKRYYKFCLKYANK